MTGRRALTAAAVASQTMHWLIVGLFTPISTLFQVERGLGLSQVGVNAAVFSLTVVLLEIPTGGLSDSIGRRNVYLLSLAAKAAAVAVLAVSGRLYGLAAGFLLLGTARALSSGALDAHFVDEFLRIDPQGDLQGFLAVPGIFIPVGLALGALIGGALPMVPTGLGRYSLNFIVIEALVFLQAPLTLLLVRGATGGAAGRGLLQGFRQVPRVIETAVRQGLKNPFVAALLAASLAWGFCFAGLEQHWQPRVRNLLGSDTRTWIFGLLTAGYFLAGSLGNALVLALRRALRRRNGLALVLLRLLLGAAFALLALQNGLAGFTAVYLVLFLINGMAGTPHIAAFNSLIGSEQRSTLLSVDSFALQVGGAAGALALGFLAQNRSIPAAWAAAAAAAGLSAVFYLRIVRRDREAQAS